MEKVDVTREHGAKQPLWTLLWPVLSLLLVALVGIVGYFFPQIQLQVSRSRGVPSIEQFGGRVPTWWSDAAKHGWTTAEEAAAGIDLDGSTITDRDLAVLRSFPHVYYLSLRHTAITDRGLVHLQAMPNLTVVHLDGSGVSQEAEEKLRGFLQRRADQIDPPAAQP